MGLSPGMRLRMRCSKAFSLGDLQWCMVHVPDHVRTVRDLAAHVSRLLELNLKGGGGELPQLLLDGFLVPHGEEVREVLRDDEVVDVEPAAAGAGLPAALVGAVEDALANGAGTGKRAAGASAAGGASQGPLGKRSKKGGEAQMALGWQPPEGAGGSGASGDRAATEAQARAAATCGEGGGGGEGAGVFVGGLPKDCGDEALRSHFERFGAVEEATVVTNRDGSPKGFGFVEFRDAAGCAAALAASDQEIAGKAIEVRPRKQKGGSKDGGKGKGAGKDKRAKGDKKGRDAKGGKGGKKGKDGPKRITLPQEDSDEEDEEEEDGEDEKAPAAAKAAASAAGKAKEAKATSVISQEELEMQKQMAAMGLPVSFTASNDRGEEEDDEDEEDEEG